MHGMRIVHNDIKPENIMYSPLYKKNVFIDFGISNILSKIIGYKTLTDFKGTYKYCGSEMKNAVFGKKRQSFIDLYKNDLDGLVSTL
jgi:serine/threonine protein kinase